MWAHGFDDPDNWLDQSHKVMWPRDVPIFFKNLRYQHFNCWPKYTWLRIMSIQFGPSHSRQCHNQINQSLRLKHGPQQVLRWVYNQPTCLLRGIRFIVVNFSSAESTERVQFGEYAESNNPPQNIRPEIWYSVKICISTSNSLIRNRPKIPIRPNPVQMFFFFFNFQFY